MMNDKIKQKCIKQSKEDKIGSPMPKAKIWGVTNLMNSTNSSFKNILI